MNKYEKKYIKISITDIAGCINKNTYISKDVMILKIWKIYDYVSFENAIKRNKLKIVNLSEIDTNVNDEKLNNYIIKYNESKINMENGLLDKPIIIEKSQKIYDIKIESNKKKYTLFVNKPKYYTNKIILNNIIINGFVNNIVDDEHKYIIDIKSRQKEMIKYIQEHEKVQIIACMKLSNIKKCQHIEYFKGDIRTEFVYYDNQKWKDIEEGLFDFINYFEKIYYNIIFQDLFLIKKIINNSNSLEMIANNLGYIIIKDN
jgi:hypothetical protein